MIIETPLPGRTHRGKVRDTYDLGGGRLLMVATDRISAFDVVLPTGIPDKGLVLNRISAFWFGKTAPHSPQPSDLPGRLARRGRLPLRRQRFRAVRADSG